MSKRPPSNQPTSRDPANSQPLRRSTSKEEKFNPVLDPKYLNVSAGGHFYERAKSRRLRTNEVFKSTADGQAVVVAEAVPLGLKRKGGGEHSMRARGVLREGVERMRSGGVTEQRNENDGVEGKARSLAARPKKSMVTDVGLKKQRSDGSRISPLVDLTNSTESDESTPSSRPITVPKPPSIQSILGEYVVVHAKPIADRQQSLFHQCMQDEPDLNTISDLLSVRSEALKRPRVTLYKTESAEKNDLDIAIWACCHCTRSLRHYSSLLLLLDAGANPNICNNTIDKKAYEANHCMSKSLQLLDTLWELHRDGHEGVNPMARALVLHGAKFMHYLNPNVFPDAKLWVESLLGGRRIDRSDWLGAKGWVEAFNGDK